MGRMRGACVAFVAALSIGGASAAAAQAEGEVDRVVKREGLPQPIGPDSEADASVGCESGERLIGGGALSGSALNILRSSTPHPSAPRFWTVTAFNSDDEDTTVTPYVFCSKEARQDTVRRVATSTGSDSKAGFGWVDAEASCLPGEKLIGGGALTDLVSGTALVSSGPDPENRRSWYAMAWNGTAETVTMDVYAYCAIASGSDKVTKSKVRTGAAQAVPSNDTRDAFAKCRRGEQLVGGGIFTGFASDTEPDGMWLALSAPDPNNARRWFTRASNGDGVGDLLSASAICVK